MHVPEQPHEAVDENGDVAIAPMRFGIMPKADCNWSNAGFERSGADSMV
jgi:hypothetical protein